MSYRCGSKFRGRCVTVCAALMCVTSLASLPKAANAQAVSLRQIANTYGGAFVTAGQAVGVGVAVIQGDHPAYYFSYGNAVASTQSNPALPFSPDLLFSIGSVTNV